MKTIYYSLVTIALAVMMVSCGNVSYKKTSSGLLYKIIPSDSKDSVVKPGNWIKLYFVQKLNDSVLASNYGKMPAYINLNMTEGRVYDPIEVLPFVKKGDSAIAIMLIDSMIKKGIVQELPPFMKKGDRIITSFKIVEIFRNDSLYQADAKIESEKDAPRAEKERIEQEAKMQKDMKEQKTKEMAATEQSGQADRERKEVEDYLGAKKINAQKTDMGTYVFVKEQGTGAQVASGKFVEVKYTGRSLPSDSVFQSSVYSFQIDLGSAIEGWHDGLKMFKEGGKGTLYIPGYLAYGNNPGPGNKTNEALAFDIEVLKVSNEKIGQ